MVRKTHTFAIDWRSAPTDAARELASTHVAAIGVRGLVEPRGAQAWAHAVARARTEWTADFGGEQFTLGRAFYTHYETDRSREYFAGAAESDARVERHLPGMQTYMRDLVAALTGGVVRARRDWCGPGVHVFPAGGVVARRGGVVHFDVEGLSERHLRGRRRTITAVVMLQEPERGGGLKLWNARYRGSTEPARSDLAADSLTVRYGTGNALVIDSYRLHQIRPFRGDRDRISITVHAAEVDDGVWETWF